MIRYLSRSEVAKKIGVAPDSLGRYNLPGPDAKIGAIRGWLESTIEHWDASRPGRGNWGRGKDGKFESQQDSSIPVM